MNFLESSFLIVPSEYTSWKATSVLLIARFFSVLSDARASLCHVSCMLSFSDLNSGHTSEVVHEKFHL